MTYQEAIDELRYQEDMREKNINYQVNNLVISMAVKALEKQIGKQLIDHKIIWNKYDEIDHWEASCPNCGARLRAYPFPNNCQFCGQALAETKEPWED